MTPHVTVFSRRTTPAPPTDGKRLAVGTARTDEIAPEALGRLSQVEETASAVDAAMADAEISDPADVAFVQIKCPLLTAGRINDAHERGQTVAVDDTYKSMGYSRGASALGVGVATGEVAADEIDDETICAQPDLYSSVASTSAGVELTHSEVMVMGNSSAVASDFAIGNAVMDDGLDTAAVKMAVETAHPRADVADVTNVFAKAQASATGTIRGRRHVIHNDSDIEATRHARAVVNSVVGAVTGDPLSYVSGGAEHQGPDGGGPVAAILDLS
jgi:cyanuric acid amidohydrolase